MESTGTSTSLILERKKDPRNTPPLSIPGVESAGPSPLEFNGPLQHPLIGLPIQKWNPVGKKVDFGQGSGDFWREWCRFLGQLPQRHGRTLPATGDNRLASSFGCRTCRELCSGGRVHVSE
jgi:hypothetical protein